MLSKIIFGILGFACVVLGMTLILRHWELMVSMLAALAGPVIAVSGLVMMFYASIKSND